MIVERESLVYLTMALCALYAQGATVKNIHVPMKPKNLPTLDKIRIRGDILYLIYVFVNNT